MYRNTIMCYYQSKKCTIYSYGDKIYKEDEIELNVHCHIIFSNKCLFIGKANITKFIDLSCKEIRIFDGIFVFLLEIKDPNSDTYVFQI